MAVSSTAPAREIKPGGVPEDGSRAYLKDGQIVRANSKWNGLPFDRGFDRILPAWRFYRINAEDLKKQMTGVNRDCNHPELSGILAEDLLPPICPVDIGDVLCSKPDDPEQAETAARRLRKAN